ncbi:diacylglycerol/lipid kinase family protein [Halobacillus seohaensis]|uniref:Diacylglycerol/lipid kinase family protein n=1 Tax=Halobacillus seohaensis TaxID=447421 RepID=A0ABW2EKT0_9BACI
MYIIIVNPEAGNGKALRLMQTIQKDPLFLEKNCRSFQTEYQGNAESLVQSIVTIHHDVVDAVIVIGGDGTLSEVFNGLHHFPTIPVGIIPAGSGNDFARGAGISSGGLEQFRKILNTPERFTFYPGVCYKYFGDQRSRRYFINSIGVGLDGKVAHFSNQQSFRKRLKKWHLHPFNYVIALLRVVYSFKPVSVDISIDGRKLKLKKASLFTIANHPYFGNGMKIAPKANLSKQTFSIISVKPLPKWKVIGLFVSVFFGKHTKLKGIHEFQGKSITLESSELLLMQADGQNLDCHKCTIEKSAKPRVILIG